MKTQVNSNTKKIFLDCGYPDFKKVKSLGAKWDPNWKMWYIGSQDDKSIFSKWLFGDISDNYQL